MKINWRIALLSGIIAASIGSADAFAKGPDRHGGGPGPRPVGHDGNGWNAAGTFVAGLLLGQALQPPVQTTYVTTREVVYPACLPPPSPVYYETRTVCYPGQPVPQTIVVPAGQPVPVYQAVVPMQTTYVQQWNGYCWQTVAVQQPVQQVYVR